MVKTTYRKRGTLDIPQQIKTNITKEAEEKGISIAKLIDIKLHEAIEGKHDGILNKKSTKEDVASVAVFQDTSQKLKKYFKEHDINETITSTVEKLFE